MNVELDVVFIQTGKRGRIQLVMTHKGKLKLNAVKVLTFQHFVKFALKVGTGIFVIKRTRRAERRTQLPEPFCLARYMVIDQSYVFAKTADVSNTFFRIIFSSEGDQADFIRF